MLKVFEILDQPRDTPLVVNLPFELRQKSRLKVTLNNGKEAGLMLPRGHLLRGGDCLRAEDGSIIRIEAADEQVSTVRHTDPVMIARASYHLGNRHVPLEITPACLKLEPDPVLENMVLQLGNTTVTQAILPFEPEAGAYSPSHSHAHAHP